MQLRSRVLSSFCGMTMASLAGGHAISAEPVSIAMKGGETAEVGVVYWVADCRSTLKGDPVAEIMEGPQDLTASIRLGKATPRTGGCAKPVAGGTLVLTAPKEVKARTQARLTIRLKYPTLDGPRQASREYNVTLFP